MYLRPRALQWLKINANQSIVTYFNADNRDLNLTSELLNLASTLPFFSQELESGRTGGVS